MTIFRNFKNQSQRFMTMFGIMYRYKKVEILQGESSALEKFKEHTRVVKMDKKRLKITLKVSNDVKKEYPATKKYIENRLEEECPKENIQLEEVIFLFPYWEVKSQLAQKKHFILQCQVLKQKGFNYTQLSVLRDIVRS